MNATREEALLTFAVEKPVEKCTAFQSARGLAHSKTWRTLWRPCHARSVLDCGSPLPLFLRDAIRPEAKFRPSPSHAQDLADFAAAPALAKRLGLR